MPILLLILLVGVFAYLWWQRRTTTLTRDCRWWQDRTSGSWHCAFCGAELAQEKAPTVCLKGQQ